MYAVTLNRSMRWSLLIVGIVTCAKLIADEPQQPAAKSSDSPMATRYLLGEYLTANAVLATNQLGIEVAPAEKTLCAQLGIQGGLVITNVPDGSEGAKAGLQTHDVMLNINSPRSEPVRDVEYLNAILTTNAGKSIEIGLLRGGKMQLVGLTVPQRQNLALQTQQFAGVGTLLLADQQGTERFQIGVSLAEADDTLRAQLQLPAGEGLVVTEVLAGTPAEKAGVKQHDVLVELDGKRLTKVEEITQQVQEIKSRSVAARLIRHGKPETIEVVPEKVAAATTIAPSDSPYIVLEKTLHLTTRLGNGGAELVLVPRITTTASANTITGPTPKDPLAQISALKQQLGEMQEIARCARSLPGHRGTEADSST